MKIVVEKDQIRLDKYLADITDYSRSTFNIANDLFVTEEIQEKSKTKPTKKNILSEGKFFNIKNKKGKIKKNNILNPNIKLEIKSHIFSIIDY